MEDQIIESLNEAKRLFDKTEINNQLAAIFAVDDVKILQGFYNNDAFYDLLKEAGTPEVFFGTSSGEKKVLGSLAQFLLVHYVITKDCPDINTLNKLKDYIKDNEKVKQPFMHWSDGAKFIIYLANTNRQTWIEFARDCEGDWASIHLLDGSLPYCKVDLSAVFYFIDRANVSNPGDLGIRVLGNNIVRKLQLNSDLRIELDSRMAEVFSNPNLKILLPSFIKGLVNENSDVFKTQLSKIVSTYDKDHLADALFALGVACPNDAGCEQFFGQIVDINMGRQVLSSAEYINILGTRNLLTQNIIDFIEKLSETSQDFTELSAISSYLLNNLDQYFQEDWYKTIAGNIIKAPQSELINIYNHLIHLIIEKNVEMVYSLLTIRFSHIGEVNFLEEFWHELVDKDPELFSRQLTDWFNLGNKNVHRTLLKLSTVNGISINYFKLSQIKLADLSSVEKLYISYKIAGYMYSCEHLQSLMFSLMLSVNPSETNLFPPLFNIFLNYVIYN